MTMSIHGLQPQNVAGPLEATVHQLITFMNHELLREESDEVEAETPLLENGDA